MDETLKTRHRLVDYLALTPYINFEHLAIREFLQGFRDPDWSDVEAACELYTFVRDAVAHSGDIQSRRVTRTASDAFIHHEGICYAKSHLLAALLRGAGIPAGICYQKLTFEDTPASGYCVHALNTAYLASEGRWVRMDARGNKPGVQAEFSLDAERLAFSVRAGEGEIDYRINHPEPHPLIIQTLERFTDCRRMLTPGSLPTEIPAGDD